MPNREFSDFISAIKTHRLDKVKAFIEANNNLETVNTVTEEGENALYAAVCGQIKKDQCVTQNPHLLFALQEANTYHTHFIRSLIQDSTQDGTSLPVILTSSETHNINTSMAAAAAPSTATFSRKN